jgi:hypothetical protein
VGEAHKNLTQQLREAVSLFNGYHFSRTTDTFFRIGLTVNRKSPETGSVNADRPVELLPVERVPPFSLGDPCGRSWVTFMLNVVGPVA